MNIDLSFFDDYKKSNINCDYDFESYNKIKNVPSSNYNFNDDTWEIDTKHAKQLFKELDEINLDILNKLNNLNIKFESYDTDIKEEVIKTIKIDVKENQKSLNIKFDYDEKVLNIVKQTDNRQWNQKNKTWRVRKNEIEWLYGKLSELKYVDISELEKFVKIDKVEIDLGNYPKMTITPKDYQIDVANKILTGKKVINALEAGLGKTLITVLATEHLQEKTLVICLSSNKYNWEKEIRKVNPDADIKVLNSKDEWVSSQYVILNYDILDKFKNEIKNAGFSTIVIDEAHKIRGVNGRGEPKSIRAKVTISLCEKAEYVFPITATPFINYTKDIFNLLKVIDHPSGDDWYAFANTYCGAENNGYGTTYNGSSNQDQLNERLYPKYMIRMRTEDKVDLPDRVRSFVPVKINLNKYNRKVREYLENRGTLETNGQHLTELTIMRMELALEKAKHAVDMVKNLLDQNKSVAIFTNYTNVVEYLEGRFKDDCVKITGDVKDIDRQKAVDLFQEGKKKVFIGNMDAAGEAITLTKAYEMIVPDMHWSPITMVNQVEKRLHRISQTQTVNIHYLYSEDAKLDKAMIEMLNRKLSDSSMILDGKSEDFFVEELVKRIN